MQVFPQAIKKSRARIEFKRVILAVNFQVNVYRIFHTGSYRLFGAFADEMLISRGPKVIAALVTANCLRNFRRVSE
jgi:hypothetical protein